MADPGVPPVTLDLDEPLIAVAADAPVASKKDHRDFRVRQHREEGDEFGRAQSRGSVGLFNELTKIDDVSRRSRRREAASQRREGRSLGRQCATRRHGWVQGRARRIGASTLRTLRKPMITRPRDWTVIAPTLMFAAYQFAPA
ncbi:hypothetical protein M6B22_06725 [Jatrophihabitans cynanchi]|uniref:Uncharacterized protein n=1 Tax=Jatrophihabitans cynanchi TaxID=2944128 RepID=A0ABY7K0S1_9ACTN|nr:hypothetical protein [Jatrophihabitans sp. SB3-54]WAX58451.1 hypothetical protein M6B22_06725 [Jatrophihabitans sp. SB3-54]